MKLPRKFPGKFPPNKYNKKLPWSFTYIQRELKLIKNYIPLDTYICNINIIEVSHIVINSIK